MKDLKELQDIYEEFIKELETSNSRLSQEFVESFCRYKATYSITANTIETYIIGELLKQPKRFNRVATKSSDNMSSFSEMVGEGSFEDVESSKEVIDVDYSTDTKELSEEEKNKLLDKAILEFREKEAKYIAEGNTISEHIIENFVRYYCSMSGGISSEELYNRIVLDYTRRSTGSEGIVENKELTQND